MRRWWSRLSVVLIFVVAGLAIYAVWPDQPDRYLPDFVPWPHGRGVPSTIAGIDLPCKSNAPAASGAASGSAEKKNPASDCRGMTLGLDLQGGSRIELQADLSGPNAKDVNLDEALGAAK